MRHGDLLVYRSCSGNPMEMSKVFMSRPLAGHFFFGPGTPRPTIYKWLAINWMMNPIFT